MWIIDLVEFVNYSEVIVKWDLVELEKEGFVRWIRGGVMIIDNKKIDLFYLMKMNEWSNEMSKIRIVDIVKLLICDDMVIFLDFSLILLYLIDVLSKFDGL